MPASLTQDTELHFPLSALYMVTMIKVGTTYPLGIQLVLIAAEQQNNDGERNAISRVRNLELLRPLVT
jgi:hypothetical protein